MRDVPHFTLSGRQTTGVNDRFGGAGESHGLGRRPSRADLTPVDEAAIADYTAGVRKAVTANRFRDKRENHLDSLYYWREVEG